LAARGAGIARHAEMEPIMAAAGVTEAGPLGIQVDGRVAVDRHGAVLGRFDFPQYLTSWSYVYNPLKAAFPRERYHSGRELVAIGHAAGRPVARFADGEAVAADLIVGADGFRSKVRALMAPGTEPRYAGYVAWRGLVAETELADDFRAGGFGQYCFCFPPGGQFIGYPVAGGDDSVEPGRRRYNFLWYRHVPDGAPLADLLTDDDGHRHEYAIPPPLIRRDLVERLRRDAARDLPAPLAAVVALAERPMLQPIYDVASERIAFEGVALVGDAAFVARPHAGIGVLKAGEDGFALARSLAQGGTVAAALARYEAERLPEGKAAVALGRRLGTFIERGLESPQSDPALGLTTAFILRVSARPPSHSPDLLTRVPA
ncbi:MAG: FAD-dependent monooxygenase, partial [Alphaproteobacteria bacterium]|nr:FAD-dependent monooxygenase [Alphaproteobacteria bacterium]